MFREVMQRLLASKTRVLVTNQLQFLPQCDLVVVMEQGKIVQQGTFAELMASGLDFARMVTKHGLQDEASPSAPLQLKKPAGSAVPLPIAASPTGASVSAESEHAAAATAAPDGGITSSAVILTDNHGAVAPQPASGVSEASNLSPLDAVGLATAPSSAGSTMVPGEANGTPPVPQPNGANTIEGVQLNGAAAGHPSTALAVKLNEGTAPLSPEKNGTSGSPAKAKAAEKLITVEERAEGEVPWSTYIYYMQSAGPLLFFMVFMGFTGTVSRCAVFDDVGHSGSCNMSGTEASRLALDFWLATWSGRRNRVGEDTDYYLGVYGAFGVAAVFFVFVRSLAFAAGRIKVSRVIMARAFDRMVRAPMRFFDTTPVGRILNRFSRDQDAIDQLMGQAVMQTMNNTFQVMSTIVAISIASKGAFLLALVPLMTMYFFMQRFFRKSATVTICLIIIAALRLRCFIENVVCRLQDLQRLESISRSPVFAQFSETLTGASTIRAYGAEERFQLRNQQLLDINTRTGCVFVQPCIHIRGWRASRRAQSHSRFWISSHLSVFIGCLLALLIAAHSICRIRFHRMLYTIIFNWLAIRLDILGALLAFTVAIVAVSAPSFLDPGWAALALSYAFNVTELLKNMVRWLRPGHCDYAVS